MKPATPTLLYIDDDAGLARLVDRGLTRAGFKVDHASGGEQGLARLAQGGIDVVALDQYMPGLDGLETLERIMAIPDAPHTPTKHTEEFVKTVAAFLVTVLPPARGS